MAANGVTLPSGTTDTDAVTDEMHATLVCRRADGSPADVDPSDVDFEGRAAQLTDDGGCTTGGAGADAVVPGAAVGGAGGAVVGRERRAGAARVIIARVTRTSAGVFQAYYRMRVFDRSASHRGELHARVRGVSVLNSPVRFVLHASPTIRWDRQVP